MREPESLDEQALNEDCNPPEYQHPEDTTELFEEYERMTDDRIQD
jgi:hypothetical protein